MKHILSAAALTLATALPAQAFERMMRSDCQFAFEKLAEMVANFDGANNDDRIGRMSQSVRVTPQGWCQMRGGDPGFENAEFDKFEWRAEGISRWTRDGIPPLAIEVLITGLEPDEMQGGISTNRPPLSVEALIRQVPEAGQLIVERAEMYNATGDRMVVSGVFDRVFLSSESMMQVSLGSAAFKTGLLSMTLEGTHENPFAFGIDVELRGNPQAQRDGAFGVISDLPDGVIDDASRAELTAYAGDLPKPVGNLEVIVSSERGLGLMQVGSAMYSSFEQIVNEDSRRDGLEILLDGLTINADWTPAAQVAD